MEAIAGRKKLRKPYTITRPRERWAAGEHERFLDALLLFGRDWKKIEEFVGTKTAIQIRSHAQKYFLKVQKSGGRVANLPPPHPTLRAPPHSMSRTSGLAAGYSVGCHGGLLAQGVGCATGHEEQNQSNCAVDSAFAGIYRFIGDMFDPGMACPVEVHMAKLKDMDSNTVEIILKMITNLENNLSEPGLFSSFSQRKLLPAPVHVSGACSYGFTTDCVVPNTLDDEWMMEIDGQFNDIDQQFVTPTFSF